METNKTSSSVVDVPKKASEADLFGIDKYKNGLIRFIENSETPITVAIQGEWGSGKTSLMNSIQNDLCGEIPEDLKEHAHPFYGVWVNTWQYSLMRSQEETLVAIVSSITAKIVEMIDARHKGSLEKGFNSLLSFGRRGLKMVTKVAGDKLIGEGSGDSVAALLESEQANQTIKHLRDELQLAIDKCLYLDDKKNQAKKGFIFFIDDLDRIDPPVAVQILELLKNIFDLKNCLFILAIDYDVVIKGLKPKFGELTDKNEREFRSFFDKIIQMPFSMPVATYNIDRFLIENLEKIKFIDKAQNKDLDIAENLSMLCNLSVGTNPRSLKRLLNTISLITIINEEDNESGDNKTDTANLLINFGLICIQIAYPIIYKCLGMEGDFKNWNAGFAAKLKLRELSATEIEKLSKAEEFDEEWEQIIFRICEKDTYLSNRVTQISQLLNRLAKLVPEGKNLGEVIEEVLELSAVTDIQAFDKPKQTINKGPVLKTLGAKLMPLLHEKLKAPYTIVRQQGKKVVSNFTFAFSKPEEGMKNVVQMGLGPHKESFMLAIWQHPWLFKAKSKDLRQDLKSEGMLEEFETIAKGFDGLANEFNNFKFRYPGISSSGLAEKKWHVPHLTFEFVFSNPQDLYEAAQLNSMAEFITEFMQQFSTLYTFAAKYNAQVNKT